MKKVVFATGSRADYGIVRNYLKLLNDDKEINLGILATGALLSSEYGHQVDLIYDDGYAVDKEIDIEVNSASIESTIHSMAVALDKFGEYFSKIKPDLLIVLGDRYEMMSVAIAAAMNRIPILHIHGGEATYGNYDEFIRHSITKMSFYHFASTDEYRKRIIQLGEREDRVFNLGALGALNCLNIEENKVSQEVKGLANSKYFVVLFHPETLSDISVSEQTEELLSAIDRQGPEIRFAFIGSNADTHSDSIRKLIKNYVRKHDKCIYFENLTTSGYHFLVKKSLGLIGNSSSGIIEVPSLGTMTINIGNRQAGRVRGNSIIDVPCDCEKISEAINQIIRGGIPNKIINPYLKLDALDQYYKRTVEILRRIDEGESRSPKEFIDVI